MNKFKILLLAFYGEAIKLYFKIFLCKFQHGLNKTEIRKEKVIVSLTSYGRRVSATLPFTIISLLRQTYKPDMILLWLDYDTWNENNIPERLAQLQKYGLSIKYCKDIKSYKKLIPTLELYPNDVIITCDDDLFYSKDMVEKLMQEYKKDPSCIYTHRAHRVGISKSKELLPYNNWEEEISGTKGCLVFPTSGGGCLYKKSLLHNDVVNESLFMQLAPKADDVWFYFMALLQKTTCVVLPHQGFAYIPIDVFYQAFHADSNLTKTNCGQSQNDFQIKAVMRYYNIDADDIKNKLCDNC